MRKTTEVKKFEKKPAKAINEKKAGEAIKLEKKLAKAIKFEKKASQSHKIRDCNSSLFFYEENDSAPREGVFPRAKPDLSF